MYSEGINTYSFTAIFVQAQTANIFARFFYVYNTMFTVENGSNSGAKINQW
jgi:hypothetical protein